MVGLQSRSLELNVSMLVSLEEGLRLGTRSLGLNSHLPDLINTIWIRNGGDYFNGFQMALFFNVSCERLVNDVVNSRESQGQQDRFYRLCKEAKNNHGLLNIVSCGVSSAMVILAETTGFMTFPDVNDIPAGILGALTYFGTRYWATRYLQDAKR